ALDADVIIKITMSDSPREILQIINENMIVKAEENDQLSQLTRQLEEMQSQVKDYEKAIQDSAKQVEALQKASDELRLKEIEIKSRKVDIDKDIADDRLQLDRSKAESEAKKDMEIVKLEREQLYSDSVKGNAREVRNNF